MIFLPRFAYALVVAILLALASPWILGGLTPAILLTLLLTGAVLADSLYIPREALRVTRNVPPILRQAQPFSVELQPDQSRRERRRRSRSSIRRPPISPASAVPLRCGCAATKPRHAPTSSRATGAAASASARSSIASPARSA